jgi:uncharacterized membrane protein
MPTYIMLAVAAMVVLALADFALKQASGKISDSLGTLLYASAALAVPLVWTIAGAARNEIFATRDGVLWSLATGVCFSLFTVLLFLIYRSGADLSTISPLVRAGGLTFAAVLGIVVLRERLTYEFGLGLLLALVGLLLIGSSRLRV